MHLSLRWRFVVPLAVVLTAAAYSVVPLVDQLTLKWFVRDLDIRATLLANTMHESLGALLQEGNRGKVQRFLNRTTQDERLLAVAYCDARQTLLYKTPAFPPELRCAPDAPQDGAPSRLVKLGSGLAHVAYKPLESENGDKASLVLVHDMSFTQRRSEDTKKYIFYLFIAIGAVTSLIAVVIAELSWRGWVAGMKALLSGEGLLRSPEQLRMPELRPIAKDLQALISDLEADRRSRDESQVSWAPEMLRSILREELTGDEIIIVSNREPYIHVRKKDGSIELQRPASGLVTALEPVMRACSGTWIAHGAGSADRETVDARDHVAVPPEAPAYRIRRVWLSAEEEAGYYYGFANEGLWPLCHIAHTRPVFRTADWAHYVQVNRKFAAVVKQEARTANPIVLVQDYHLALLPKMVRDQLPDATIITFWHIPWPNPETFSICPWREQILKGLLGSSILGFHTQFHCNNFFDTADRFLEARVDRETFNISFGGESTAVHRYPISIEWPPVALATALPVAQCRSAVRGRNGLGADALLGVGVDRLDYTKGILERFMAVERLLELEPQWIGRFVFMQIAAPSRSQIDEYQNFDTRVRALAGRINQRFARPGYEPICLKVEHHDVHEVYECYRAAELCFVSSLHDGMNLVAKEFVAARDDERGVLILSQFAGASKEMVEALIVNPYNIDECAAGLHLALTMPPQEQRERMRSMRGLIQEFNVYRWAGRMLLDAARMRRRRRMPKAGSASAPAKTRSAA
jgi:trehalose 6-phosphate synthase